MMSIEAGRIVVAGLPVRILRKSIKNLHLGVYPPDGHIRVSAPLAVNNDAVRLAVVSRLGWIRRQRAHFQGQERQAARRMLSGETHFIFGRRYRLRVVEGEGPREIVIVNATTAELRVAKHSSAPRRANLVARWYRSQLRAKALPLVAKWARKIGIDTPLLGIKRMKTKWGSCSAVTRRIWLNLELAKKPLACLEYLIVHELVHFLERRHSDAFGELMDRHLPHWRHLRHQLNAAPLGHEKWSY